MSEQEPTFESPKSADHTELDRLEATLLKKKFELEQNEKFGKYDSIEGPLNEGEQFMANSHAAYHAQRPSEGIVRDGDALHRTGGSAAGAFASEAAYEAQKGNPYNEGDVANAGRYYDGLIGGNEVNEAPIGTDYEAMNPRQLALEAAKANELGDSAEMNDIRETLNIRLLNEVTTPGTQMTEEDYHEGMAQYDHLVTLAIQRRVGKTSEQPVATAAAAVDTGEAIADNAPADSEAPVEATVAGDTSEVVGGDTIDEPEARTDTGAASGEATDDSAPTKPEAATEPTESERKPGNIVELLGTKVTIGQILRGPDGTVAYEVIEEDGSRVLAYEADLMSVEEREEKDSPTERIKAFWKKSKGFIVEKFTLGYMSAKWTIEDTVINRGIDHTTSFEDAEKIKRRRRTALLAGAAAVIVAGIVLKNQDAVAHLFNGGSGLDAGVPNPTHTAVATEGLSAHDQAIADAMHSGSSGVETGAVDPSTVAPNIAPDAAFNVTPNEGGYQLFNRLGIPTAVWDTNASSLLQRFPQNFYSMDGGGVGLRNVPIGDTLQTVLNGLGKSVDPAFTLTPIQ